MELAVRDGFVETRPPPGGLPPRRFRWVELRSRAVAPPETTGQVLAGAPAETHIRRDGHPTGGLPCFFARQLCLWPPEDVVNLKNLRFARIDTDLRENRHERCAERLPLLTGIPDLANANAVFRTKQTWNSQPSGPASPSFSLRRRIVSWYCSSGTPCGENRTRMLTRNLLVWGEHRISDVTGIRWPKPTTSGAQNQGKGLCLRRRRRLEASDAEQPLVDPVGIVRDRAEFPVGCCRRAELVLPPVRSREGRLG